MSKNYAQIPIIKFKNRMFIRQFVPPLIQKQLFGLQDELVVYFCHFSNIIMLTKDQRIFVLTETPSKLEDTAIQNRKN